jgi:hypothetical protein
MSAESHDIRKLTSQLQLAHFRSYLLGRGWEEMPSRFVDHVYFKVQKQEDGSSYDLYLPATPAVPKYRTRQMRAIYKLCGIEEREPDEITRDLLASDISPRRPAQAASSASGAIRLRFVNSGSIPLHVRVDSPLREHELLPDEAIELKCDVANGCLEIERDDTSLTIVTMRRS